MTNTTEFKLSSISTIMLGVRSIETSLPFYRDVLGLSVQATSPGFAFLSGGGVMLALSEPLFHASDQIVGATEVVFRVPDVSTAHAALVERGVNFVIEPRQVTPTEWSANFADPDGHRLSIFGPITS